MLSKSLWFYQRHKFYGFYSSEVTKLNVVKLKGGNTFKLNLVVL